MTNAIAIVGMACQYPDAASPSELWANALAGRRSFRRMPSVRMNADDYLSADVATSDHTYVLQAAVINGYEFDRVAFRVAGGTYRSADLAHWLALDVASRALADAGFAEGEGLPREMTGVLLGNTLTGEFSRANLMRLRWPYVRRVLEQELQEAGWTPEQRARFLARTESRYKAPFPPVGEETLAGGLSNTIAGRICNYFDLKGGGYTLDGACASSLLAIANACTALVAGDLDVAVAGGVDLSLDPFEVIGFAKTGALAPQAMRVYDARSAGFWPGEGCGFVVMMRHDDAVAQGRRIYATVRGWGISSDGSGGITRPEVDGQILALQRAYRRAGFGIDTIAYFEGHGTGTNVGDTTELQTVSRARREANPTAPAAAISSVKAIIGHTKAAAGVAGLIKAAMALHNQVIPPTIGCETPHTILSGPDALLRMVPTATPWPADQHVRASVSAMGFGGINTHVVMEGAAPRRRPALDARERRLARSRQDAELFVLGAESHASMLERVNQLRTPARGLSLAEMGDLADSLSHALDASHVRAALVAATPAELSERLDELASWLDAGVTHRLETGHGLFLSTGQATPHIAFLFPGQGSPAHLTGGIMRTRFDAVRELYERAGLPAAGDGISTRIAQPAIVTASRAALDLLERYGLEASVAVGHSLGELSALHWGGAYDADGLLRIARVRGAAMADLGSPTGAMASIAAHEEDVCRLLGGLDAVIAGLNSPRQTVVSGDASAVAAVVERARAAGLHVAMLPVSHAFHSPLVAAAAAALAEALEHEVLSPLGRDVISTVTGRLLPSDADVRDVLLRQITSPVRFTEAASRALDRADLAIEVGPGSVLSGLVASMIDVPVIATDAGGSSLRGILAALGAAYTLGAPISHRELFADRYLRPFDILRPGAFFVNPCETVPSVGSALSDGTSTAAMEFPAPLENHDALPLREPSGQTEGGGAGAGETVLELVRRLVAERAELPSDAVRDDSRLLVDLHLNSITIGQIVIAAAKGIGLPSPASPTQFANATVIEVAEALELLRSTSGGEEVAEPAGPPQGVDTWVRTFASRLVDAGPLPVREAGVPGAWRLIAPEGHPIAPAVRSVLERAEGDGVFVCLPEQAGDEVVPLLLESVRVLNAVNKGCWVLLQCNGGAAGFARTLHLEKPRVPVTVIDLPSYDHPEAMAWIAAEVAAASGGGYREIHYDAGGARLTPLLERVDVEPFDAVPLGENDLLLVSGGGKGIAAESALELARRYGAALLLMGRARPDNDAELAANLARLDDAGIRYEYVSADAGDADEVRAALLLGQERLGQPVTAFLHGAGTNVPQAIDLLSADDFARTLRPKVHGARNILAALDPGHLKLLITFSSIIGRAGLRGEADYALANEWLTRLTEQWGEEHPECRCIALEWSIWSGVGMGERLGRVEALMREGIHPIPPEAGIDMLLRVVAGRPADVALVVTSRFGSLPTIRTARPELPLLRFLESPLVHYPGIELVADAHVSSDTDPYLADHTLRGEAIVPAVMGLEAFAQAASALRGSDEGGVMFTNVRFARPVVVPAGERVTVRVAALRRESGEIDLALRSAETGFQADHFSATCRAVPENVSDEPENVSDEPENIPGETEWSLPEELLPFDADRTMYSEILFQRGRFRRLRGYRTLRALECIADIAVDSSVAWFSQYLPGRRLLGDPGARDAAIHCIQGCIPHMTLLPVSVERIVIGSAPADGVMHVHARERWHEGDDFLYDMDIRDGSGRICEQWRGLLLHAVERNRHRDAWGPILLGPYVERRMAEIVPGAALSVAVKQSAEPKAPDWKTVEWSGTERRERSNGALREAAGVKTRIARRGDGKPVAHDGTGLSASHAGGTTLAVAAQGDVGCDIEPVAGREAELWRGLLGTERHALAELIASELTEDPDAAATRVWAASESLEKAGLTHAAPLTFDSAGPDGWALLRSGPLVVGTYVDRDEAASSATSPSLAVAVAVRDRNEGRHAG
ncbi:MAG: SDR family NAD(P)-dependent oxidoreductase [Bacteroidetes bacterium]|nr:SDR family NAD(P)-dependent oxidoreductase [Bacteroidota bacterium]